MKPLYDYEATYKCPRCDIFWNIRFMDHCWLCGHDGEKCNPEWRNRVSGAFTPQLKDMILDG